MLRYQPADQILSDQTVYRIMDCSANHMTLLDGSLRDQRTRNEVLAYLNQGYALTTALWYCCAEIEWRNSTKGQAFMLFARARVRCLEYPALMSIEPRRCYVSEWADGRPTAFVEG